MVTPWKFDCLAERIISLDSEIDRIYRKDHPYKEPRIVYLALRYVLKRNRKFLSDQKEWFKDSPKKERITGQNYETVLKEVNRVEEIFNSVNRVDSSRIPFEILRALSWAAEDLLEGKFRVVVNLDPGINYTIKSTKREFEKPKKAAWKEDLDKSIKFYDLGEEDILLLGIPSIYANSILLNAIAAHEMGHLLFFKKEIVLREIIKTVYQQVKENSRDSLQNYLTDLATQEGRYGGGIKDSYIIKAKELLGDINKVSLYWCMELFSDLVAARLVGPAIIAAFDRVSVGQEDMPTPTHPPNEFRRALLKEYFETEMPTIMNDPVWSSLFGDSIHTSWVSNPLWRFGREMCKAAIRPFTEKVRDIKSPFDTNGYEFSLLIAEMQSHMENLSLPSVVFRERKKWMDPLGFWSMFYAAWHFRLDQDRFQRFLDRLDLTSPLEGEEILGNLLLQGFKSAELACAKGAVSCVQ